MNTKQNSVVSTKNKESQQAGITSGKSLGVTSIQKIVVSDRIPSPLPSQNTNSKKEGEIKSPKKLESRAKLETEVKNS